MSRTVRVFDGGPTGIRNVRTKIPPIVSRVVVKMDGRECKVITTVKARREVRGRFPLFSEASSGGEGLNKRRVREWLQTNNKCDGSSGKKFSGIQK